MKKISFVILIAVAIFASCNSSNTRNNSKQTLIVATADATIKYQCPMKCEGDTAYTTAGECPICEMDLKKTAE
ncbi:MAG: heavy metal-binding domain-containing protein [Bacteroidetes bacterium]|nr:heavy metal-binding domain-containing protein [Bacteroidota bacterium]